MRHLFMMIGGGGSIVKIIPINRQPAVFGSSLAGEQGNDSPITLKLKGFWMV
jgi:hypothetical protein